MAAAVGTALDDGRKINLLPHEVVTDRNIAKAKNLFQVLLIAGLVWMFYGRQQAGKELPRLRASIATGREALSLMQDGLAKVEILNRLRSELSSAQEILAQRNGKHPNWVDVLKDISTIIPESIVLRELAPVSDSNEKSIVLRGEVLQGALIKNLEVSQFLLRLEGSPFFKGVRLRPSKGRESEEMGKFEIICVLAY
jgi:Tfp pilus assembly protein PilN